MTVIIGGIVLTAMDRSAYGITALITGVATLVGLFLYAQRSQHVDAESASPDRDAADEERDHDGERR